MWLLSGSTVFLFLLATESTLGLVNYDQVQRLLQISEYHRENYYKSLQDLDFALEQLTLDQVKLLKTETRISKRSEVKQLFNSFQAFCNSLNNGNGTGIVGEPHQTGDYSNHTRSQENKHDNGEITIGKQKDKWYTPELLFRPIKIRARYSKKSKKLIVEVSVEHKVPIYSYAAINPMFIRQGRTTVHPNKNNIKKSSIAKFRIDTQNCEKENKFSDILQIQFAEFGFMGQSCTINIRPCIGIYYDKWAHIDLEFNDFQWSLPNNHINSEYRTSFDVLFENIPDIEFSVSTFGYDMKSRELFASDESFDLRESSHHWRQSLFGDGNSSLAKVEVNPEISDDNNMDSEGNNGQSSKEKPQPIATFKLDAEFSSKSGFLSIGQQYRPDRENSRDNIVMETYHYMHVAIGERQNIIPIPDNKVGFVEFGVDSVCNSNWRVKDKYWYCGLRCLVLARNIAGMSIEKVGSSTRLDSSEVESTTQILQSGVGRSILTINKRYSKYQGDYVCRVTLKNGVVETQNLSLTFVGMPYIDENEFKVRIDMDGFMAHIYCNASGTDLDVNIEAFQGYDIMFNMQSIPWSNNDTSVTTRNHGDIVERIVDIPVQRLREYNADVIKCSASNSHSKIYPIRIELGGYYTPGTYTSRDSYAYA